MHLSNIMKRIYFLLYAPRDRRKPLVFSNIEIEVLVRNYGELRTVEAVLENDAVDESKIIEPMLNILREGDVAFDIGANIGIHTMLMAKKAGVHGKVIAFEPEENNYETLLKNIRMNKMQNVLTVKTALGDTVEDGKLYVNKHVGIGAISLIESTDSDMCQMVEVRPGDYLVEKLNLPVPKVVKIDVEGFEYPVIKGLLKTLSDKNCELLCCEIHKTLYPSGTTKEAVIDLIRKLGFRSIDTYFRGGEIHVVAFRD